MENETSEQMQARWAKEEADRRENGKQFLLSLVPKMRELEYRYLVAFFDGSGDSGQMDAIVLSNEDAAIDARYEGDVDGEEPSILFDDANGEAQSKALEEHIWDLTPPGFENNEGGFGAVILDAEEAKVKMNYSYRVEDSVAADEEF